MEVQVTKFYMHNGKEEMRHMAFSQVQWKRMLKEKPEKGVRWELRKVVPVNIKETDIIKGDLKELTLIADTVSTKKAK